MLCYVMLLTFSLPSFQRTPYQQSCIELTTIDNLGFVNFLLESVTVYRLLIKFNVNHKY